jgi:hypothetical protein
LLRIIELLEPEKTLPLLVSSVRQWRRQLRVNCWTWRGVRVVIERGALSDGEEREPGVSASTASAAICWLYCWNEAATATTMLRAPVADSGRYLYLSADLLLQHLLP